MPANKKPAKDKPKAKPKTDDSISPKIQAFINAYCNNDRNGTQAAITAGYAPGSAHVTASRLLKIAKVKEQIDKQLTAAQQRSGVTLDRLLVEIGNLALSDPAELFGPDGELLHVKDMPPHMRAAIASVEVETLFAGFGSDRVPIGTTTKLKMWDKNSAADKLMRYLGAYKKDNEQSKSPLEDFFALVGQAQASRLQVKP